MKRSMLRWDRRCRNTGPAFASMLFMALAWAGGAVHGAGVPGAIQEALGDLDKEFYGMVGVGSPRYNMECSIAQNQGRIEAVLAWGAASDRNAAVLSGTILAAGDGFATQFRPGAHIDDVVLRKRSWEFGTQPGHGLVIGTHILMLLSRRNCLPAGARQALSAACRAVDAAAYLAEQSDLRAQPELRDDFEREKRVMGGYCCTFGAEMAWVCEQFMLAELASERSMLPEAALKVAREYSMWREEIVPREEYYHQGRQHHIMAFVRRLADALPAAPAGAQAEAWKRRR